MRRLQKGMLMDFIQGLAYRAGGKVLLMLGLFVVLSLAFTTFGQDQVLDVMAYDGPKGMDSGAGGSPGDAVLSLQAVPSLREVKDATLRIVAEGSFEEPEGTALNVSGSGSGFIIDPSGIAITNNHVVTGAAVIEVWVGDEDEPRRARVLGVSECSDLAFIDLDGEGYRYLEWFYGEIFAGLDVYAAGFPAGDPEFTLTRGIISKVRANGNTNWTSVDSVLQHDATISPGSSGGPLVTADGKVVGINFALGRRGLDQYFAISREEVGKIIDPLRDGQDVTSIGINGRALISRNEEGEYLFSGIWVSSVETDSPADKADIRGRDILFRLEGLVLATDGTLADYCSILRSHQPGDVLAFEVWRYVASDGTWQRVTGRLNADEQER